MTVCRGDRNSIVQDKCAGDLFERNDSVWPGRFGGSKNSRADLVKYLNPEPSQIDLNVEIRNAFIGNSKLHLIPHPVSSYGFGYNDWRPAPESSAKRRIRVPIEELKARPDVVAHSLVGQIFIWFGVMADMIPYASVEADVRFIDADKIKNTRSQ